jgi:hypothetical protein
LSEEERPLQIGRHDFIVACLANLEHIHPLTGTHPGVVDQQIYAAIFFDRFPDDPLPVICYSDIPLNDDAVSLVGFYCLLGTLRRLAIAFIVDYYIPAAFCQG